MARDRIISATPKEEDQRIEVSLRPQSLHEMIGQGAIMEKLEIALTAAMRRGEALEHVLLDGPPGLGKTTLANVIARHMADRPPRVTSGPALAKQADLMAMLTSLEEGEVLFIDEIHRLPKVVEEFLYPAMEDFRVDFTVEGGLGGRVVNFALKRFTLIGATTRAGMLSGAFRDRFGHDYHFEFYSTDELLTILELSSTKLELQYEQPGLELIACRSRGTPRVANRLLKRVRDYAEVRGNGVVTEQLAQDALDIQQIDELGLDALDRSYLKTLIEIYQGGPAGIEALAATMGQERDTLEDMVEPYLLQLGFAIRTRQGRAVTDKARQHLGFPSLPQTEQGTLFSSE